LVRKGIRDVEIRRLEELPGLAYGNAMDEGLRMRTRESWYQKHTNAVLALNQLLKDLQYKDYEKRLKVIEDSRKLRRIVLPGLTLGNSSGLGREEFNRERNLPTVIGGGLARWLDQPSSK
jgi:hypothetical protein